MLAESHAVIAIDVGTTKVCTVVGRKVDSGGIEVLGFASVPSDGLRKGNVFNMAATQRSVKESVQQVEMTAGLKTAGAFVGVSGSHVGFSNRRDKLTSAGRNGVVTADDLHRHPGSLVGLVTEPGRELIHAVKMSYTVDGQTGIRNPVGMHSDNVEVESHVVTGESGFLGKLRQAVEGADIDVVHLVLEPLASGLAVLTPEEKEHGAVLVDIGGGTTDIVAFRRGQIHYSKVIPVGGWQFTNDICLAFNTPFEAAERAKLLSASTNLHGVGAEERVSLPVVGQDVGLLVPRTEICQLVRDRAHELARLIKIALEDAEFADLEDPRIVVTGGASNLPGLAEVIQRNLAMPVRQGVPNAKGTIPQELKDPAYSTAVGILLWAAGEDSRPASEATNGRKHAVVVARRGLVSGLIGRLGRLRPPALFAIRKGRN